MVQLNFTHHAVHRTKSQEFWIWYACSVFVGCYKGNFSLYIHKINIPRMGKPYTFCYTINWLWNLTWKALFIPLEWDWSDWDIDTIENFAGFRFYYTNHVSLWTPYTSRGKEGWVKNVYWLQNIELEYP